MPKLPRIDFYFDVISPYSYIAFEVFQKLETQWKGVTIRYIPFFLGAVMKESGNRPPAMLPARSIMMMTDLKRTAKFWDIPLTPPPLFMEWIKKYRTTGAMKVLLVLQEQDKELMLRAAREMWVRLWSRSEKIFEDQDFVEVLKAVGVKNPEQIVEKSKDEKYIKILMENTNKGVDLMAYGAPWINVHTEDGSEHSFFGSDRFHLIADLLQQPQPLPDRLFGQKSKL
ncbi:Glutathione S-transferase kappa 1 [Caenorhabditis elegans]|uniref:Glutathione S-transferase kappa 1 n=1 Tax=Caenorhabditis elegans TaxID=6239 RepID=GSTK1_CAEEL|nr:Glutathione S-transferase kappa 1 [Caenorhabditis elegans]Q09652.1 RecName: Full=Glutathione S-transferase kappa 1; AltName: Full=GST class-kappa [Caenorhabditis elegans]CAA87039.1 Glutathione S-transferase kappa 1 [Caenorhabditis elegans]|eukprot:NP_496082.1 Glutathione S-transferase kappa 1 [Caenorhabditis elegans]